MGSVTAIAVSYCVFYFGILDRDEQSKPLCHNWIMVSLMSWPDDINRTRRFPNINGESAASLNVIDGRWDGYRVSEKYNYVPGLQVGDPDDLVLMYLRVPTRWKWHGPTPTVFSEKKWIVIPVDFTQNREGVREGELSERLSTAEFRECLQKTLGFLRKQNRSHAEAVAKEHTQFLSSIEVE
jgi:hypothetical protein